MFGLTREERRVVLFLVTVMFLGVNINFFSKRFSSASTRDILTQDIGKVDLNSADKNSLMSIPGIGEKLAQRIIDYRSEHCGFVSVEQIKDIKGVTEKKFQKLKNSFLVK